MHRPAKVGNLQLPLQPHEQILWLDIPMDHLLTVTVEEGISQLFHVLWK